jgi:molybdate transport system permease protein
VLAFARALGEFGATLMLAGNIPGKTTTVPLAIYTAVQTGEMGEAVLLVVALTILSCVVLMVAGHLGARAT